MGEVKLLTAMNRLSEEKIMGILKKLSVDFPDIDFGFQKNKLTVNGRVIEKNPFVKKQSPQKPLVWKKYHKAYSLEHCVYLCWYELLTEQKTKESEKENTNG